MFVLLGCYFYLFRPKVFNSSASVIFMLLMSVGILTLTSSVARYTSISVYIVPFALLPLMVRVFFDSRTALFLHLITVVLASIMVENKFDFLLLQIAAGMTAVSSLKDMNSRGQLVSSAIFIFLTYMFVFIGLELMKGITLAEFPWGMLVIFFINAAMLLFAYGLIYICEKIFGFLSSVTLIELSNVNNSILMDFSEKAPGTFQHALQVSNIAVEVAKKLNANSLLVRTGALYHDIGKMINPMLFTENQTNSVNPLNDMPDEQAAQVIITHVAAGVKMAEKAGLPRQVINFIRTHHGMSKTKYFYNSYKNKFPGKKIDDSMFTYPGPLPFTIEMAIVMMADVVEATSRSLPDHKEETIDNMVENVINGLIEDGQFKNAPISFRDVETAKAVFKEKLKNIYHSRVSYPELKKRK
jgi:putative nucleotidyltransferase with HDIG domain